MSTNHLNLALGDYKIGDVVTELVVSGGKVKSSENNLVEGSGKEHDGHAHDFNRRRFGSNTKQNNDYERCNDPSSKIVLYHMDNFEWAPSQQTRSSRPLVLMTEVYQLGRFDGKDRGQENSTPFMSVEIRGRCCWETFSEPDYRGKMLRLCRGKYNSYVLGRMAGNIKSLRPVKHF